MNEGHAALAVLERARRFMQETAQPFDVALAVTRAGNLFTTHTAVAAGFDRFAPALIGHYLGGYAEQDIHRVSDARLWQFRIAASKSLVEYARERLSRQLTASGAPPDAIESAKLQFDPHALTLGFARRFAVYKRPNLLLHDPERLLRLLTDPQGHQSPAFERLTGAQIVNRAPVRVGLCRKCFSSGTP
jgi:glucan phosphorylase